MNDKLKNSNKLVVFYSWGGNTKAVAEHIAKITEADILEIETSERYPKMYAACVGKVRKDGAAFEPKITTTIPDLSKYDVIFAGSPCWWGTIANPLRTFLHQNDFSGKTMIPFMTHGTSGINVQDIKRLCPGATVLAGHGIYNKYQVSSLINTTRNMGDFKNDIEKWLYSLEI